MGFTCKRYMIAATYHAPDGYSAHGDSSAHEQETDLESV